MKLTSLYIQGRIPGLESEKLYFGQEITELFGPNGCGKTPILQTIVYCLGYPCQFRNDIYALCHSAHLSFSIKDKEYEVVREFLQTDVVIKFLSKETNKLHHFHNQETYSKFIFDLLGLSYPSLVTIGNKQSYPYLAHLLPIYYLDQDDGYSKHYYSSSNFIKDQFSEILRIIFSLPEKHSFNSKKMSIDIKAEIEHIDNSLVIQRRNIELEKEAIKDKNRKIDDVEFELNTIKNNLNKLKNSSSIQSDSLTGIDTIISNHKDKLRLLNKESDDIKKRNFSLCKIKEEINTEIETLNLNEEAKRVFKFFKEICPSENCGMFTHSTESYGKNLLYLKDQIKDIERNINLDSKKVENIENEIIFITESINKAEGIKAELIKENDISSFVNVISEMTSNIFLLEIERSHLLKVSLLEAKYVDSLNKREQALDRQAALQKDSGIIPKLTKLKKEISLSYVKWLDILNTSNISKNISFRDDFYPILGSEKLEQLKGSTKSRAILAYRAALIEIMGKTGLCPLKFIILDTPKQHEAHYVDIDNFIIELKKLSKEFGIQIIFSSTEYQFNTDDNDQLWTPKFSGEKHNMFLKHC